jgi:hypothetical protein
VRRLLTIITSVVLLFGGLTLSAPPAQASFPCQGAPLDEPKTGLYAEPRIFMESQGWWIKEPGDPDPSGNAGHVHYATCYPLDVNGGPTVSGKVRFWIRLMMFDNPGTLNVVHAEICYSDAQVTCDPPSGIGADLNPNMTCVGPDPCTLWVQKTVDTSLYGYDGIAFLRIEARSNQPFDPPNSVIMKTSQNWPILISNGNPLPPGQPDPATQQGKGWYRAQPQGIPGEYNFASLQTGFPFPVTTGSVNFTIKCFGGAPISDCLVTVDPDFHMGDEGHVLQRFADSNSHPITITNLGDFGVGPHFLVIRSESRKLFDSQTCPSPFCPATRAGLIKVPFVVTG